MQDGFAVIALDPALNVEVCLALDQFIIRFGCPAFRTGPVLRNVLETRTGRYTRVRVAERFIVNVGTIPATEFTHGPNLTQESGYRV